MALKPLPDPKKLAAEQAKVELLAEDVLTDRRQMIELDRRRNGNREALAAFRHGQHKPGAKVWLSMGDMFVKVPVEKAKTLIETDQKRIDAQIDLLQKGLRQKTVTLHELEGRPDMTRGLTLKGLSENELLSILPEGRSYLTEAGQRDTSQSASVGIGVAH